MSGSRPVRTPSGVINVEPVTAPAARRGASVRVSSIDTPAKRGRLAPRRNPYWQTCGTSRKGLCLGYRKPAKGAGAWVARLILEKQRDEHRLGAADDLGAVPGALSYDAAFAAAAAWRDRLLAARLERPEDGALGSFLELAPLRAAGADDAADAGRVLGADPVRVEAMAEVERATSPVIASGGASPAATVAMTSAGAAAVMVRSSPCAAATRPPF